MKKKKFAKKEVAPLRLRYDAASTSRLNSSHWSLADALSPDEDASPSVRQTLRRRSRYEINNNSYANGLVQLLANETIGTGPNIQIIENPNAERIESDWREWCDAVKLPQLLRLMRRARCQDGETFVVLQSNPRLATDVKLQPVVIEADRIASDGYGLDENEVDGITYDAFGNPTSYRVLRGHPGTLCNNAEADVIGAENVLHTFIQTRPGLHRGIPELTPALPLFAQLRRFNLATLSAAESAADFACVLYTDSPADEETADIEPLDTFNLSSGSVTTLPAGWKLGQMDAKHPTSQHSEFCKAILSEIARCVCGTYGIISGDYGGFNYASGRLDRQVFQQSISIDRSNWEADILNPLFKAWYAEYRFVSDVTDAKTPQHIWQWQGQQHVDPTKEANAARLRLEAGISTLAYECGREGRDWQDVMKQRAREQELAHKLGLAQASSVYKEEEEDE